MANVMQPVIVGFDYNWVTMYSGGVQGPYYWDDVSKRWDHTIMDEFSFDDIFWVQYQAITGINDGEAIGTVVAAEQTLPSTPLQWRLIVTSTVTQRYLSPGEILAYQDITPGVDVEFNLPISVNQVLALAEYDSMLDQYIIAQAYGFCRFIIQPAAPEPTEDYKFSSQALAYELERGWSFDGEYIPHFLELNWFFGEDPVTYKSVNKVRVHGLVKGTVNLQVSMSGMQGDVATDYIADYTDPEFLDFPFAPIHVASEFVPATNYVGYQDRGLALLMKFEGRNQNIALPEPSHVLQVLALQSSPQGNGKTAN